MADAIPQKQSKTTADLGKPAAGKKRGRTLLWVLITGVGLLLLAVGVLLMVLPRVLMTYITKEAHAQGVVIERCALSYSLSKVTLTGCAFELVELPGVTGTVEKVEVALLDFKPQSVLVDGAAVVVRDLPNVPAGERVPHWLAQRSRIGKDSKLPIRVENARLDLFGFGAGGTPDDQPLVSLTKLTYDSTTENVASDITVGGLITGQLSHKDGRTALDVGLKLSPETKLRLSVDTRADGAEFRADFEQLPLAMFSAPPFIELPEELMAVQVDGQVFATVPFGLDTKGVRGDFRTTLGGLPLPVPQELQGLVADAAAQLTGKFKLHPNNQKLDISALHFKAGALKLEGNAVVELRDGGVPLKAQLSGSLSCAAIVEAATRAGNESPLTQAAIKLAKKVIDGGVGIVVALDGDLLQLKRAKLLKTIGIGCGLNPLPLPDALLDLSRDILKGLPRPPALPDVPELRLPEPPSFTLPELPRLGGDRRLQEETPAPPASQ